MTESVRRSAPESEDSLLVRPVIADDSQHTRSELPISIQRPPRSRDDYVLRSTVLLRAMKGLIEGTYE